jgi:hypothetical protein
MKQVGGGSQDKIKNNQAPENARELFRAPLHMHDHCRACQECDGMTGEKLHEAKLIKGYPAYKFFTGAESRIQPGREIKEGRHNITES